MHALNSIDCSGGGALGRALGGLTPAASKRQPTPPPPPFIWVEREGRGFRATTTNQRLLMKLIKAKEGTQQPPKALGDVGPSGPASTPSGSWGVPGRPDPGMLSPGPPACMRPRHGCTEGRASRLCGFKACAEECASALLAASLGRTLNRAAIARTTHQRSRPAGRELVGYGP
jgi:hypothetical protein